MTRTYIVSRSTPSCRAKKNIYRTTSFYSKCINLLQKLNNLFYCETKGFEIIVYEPFASYSDKNNKKFEVVTEDHYNIIPGKDGGYYPLGGFQGKINLDEKEKSANERLDKLVKDVHSN